MAKHVDQRNWLGEKPGWRQYFDLQVPRQPLLVRFGNTAQVFPADRGGYLDITVHGHGLKPGWHNATVQVVNRQDLRQHKSRLLGGHSWSALSPEELERRAAGLGIRLSRPVSIPVQIISDDAKIGIISDVDDTILVTEMPRPLEALRNAFLTRASDREAVVAMASFLTHLAARSGQDVEGLGVPFFYLSTGAWNTAPTIRAFLNHRKFPKGTLLLRPWGITDQGFPVRGVTHKIDQFRRLKAMYPQVKWILLGDDGQHDPSTFAVLAAEDPDSIEAIFIRELTSKQHKKSHFGNGAKDQPEAISYPPKISVTYAEDGYSFLQTLTSQAGYYPLSDHKVDH